MWNEGVRRIYGHEPEEVVGKPVDMRNLSEQIVSAAARQGGPA